MSDVKIGDTVRLVEYAGWKWTEERRPYIGRCGVLEPHDDPKDSDDYGWVSLGDGNGIWWSLAGMVPESVSRRISLPLAADTTATECGGCQNRARQSPNDWSLMCFAFRRMLTDDARRLPECIAAEVSP